MSATPERPKVLIVDDKKENLFALDKTLQKLPVDVFQALSGNEALGLTLEHDFCLAIVDVQMPEMDGYELVELMRGNEATATLPIIFVSAIYSDEYHHRKGYESGAVDFLSKPFVPEILLSKVRVFVDLYQQRHSLQSLVEELNRANIQLSRHAVHIEVSNEVGKQVSAILNMDELLPRVASLIQTHFQYSLVGIWLLADTKDSLVLQATTYPKLKKGLDMPLRHPGLIARAAVSNQIQIENRACLNASYVSSKGLPNVCSQLSIPLISQGETVGVLDVESERLQAFSDEDVAAIKIIAEQVTVAIQNATLYSQVVHFNEELESMVAQRTVELRKALDTLEKLDKTKSDFVRVSAHELRTPLSVIRGYAGMLMETKIGADPEAKKLITGILKGEERLLEIVNSMLDVSRIETSTLKAYKAPTSLEEIMNELHAEIHPGLTERKLTLERVDLDQLPLILADPDLIKKLFGNLIRNAVKFTPDGGQITILGKVLPATDDYPEKAVQITVKDTGIGIAPENLELIFRKFYQTGPIELHSTGLAKFKGGGPGLGLAIAQGIALAHNGKIWAESDGYDEEKLPGSAFHVILRVGHTEEALNAQKALEN
jgi:signal transduction histidine kinase/DNA-binding response OmpR family regulator